jgi:hypothetical protein
MYYPMIFFPSMVKKIDGLISKATGISSIKQNFKNTSNHDDYIIYPQYPKKYRCHFND